MKNPETAIELIFDSSISFEERCAGIFQFQAQNSSVFKRFIKTFGFKSTDIPAADDVPLLPIRGFKDGKIVVESKKKNPELTFKSSGTSDMDRSTHYMVSLKMYESAILQAFNEHFSFEEYIILFYLPGYDQNPQSSLIWMANHLKKSDPSGKSQFVSFRELKNIGTIFHNRNKKILLFGAAFGLLDVIESGMFKPVEGIEIIETGGMKTHRREMSKPELRKALSTGFQVPQKNIHSEYGMCELLSQMYAIGDEWFKAPHWVHVTIRDPKNPTRICKAGEEGKIGIIDLANIYSCPFILTDDKGVMDESGRFKVLGRWNPDDLRGCNFLIDRE
ncbi:MAG: hypothetical protein R3220_10690 [Balneolaceae bacterium]|nr:hypothetical protein [Balneolaceae bacterium]